MGQKTVETQGKLYNIAEAAAIYSSTIPLRGCAPPIIQIISCVVNRLSLITSPLGDVMTHGGLYRLRSGAAADPVEQVGEGIISPSQRKEL